MLATYSATIGAAKMHIFMMSVVGVRIAAMMKITRIEYRKFRHIHPAVTRPIKDKKKTSIGNSKITPIPMMIVRNKSVYSPMVIMGWNCLPYPIRNSSACGYTSLYPKYPPARNSPTVETINGTTYRFSLR